MVKNVIYFLAGVVVSGAIAWAIPSTCEATVNAVQGIAEQAPGILDNVRGMLPAGEGN